MRKIVGKMVKKWRDLARFGNNFYTKFLLLLHQIFTLMTVAVIFDFRKKAPNANDAGTVSIRIFKNGRLQILSTGVRCRRCEWSDKRWVIKREDAADLNKRIQEAYDEALRSNGEKLHTLKSGNAPFLDWMAKEIEKLRLRNDTIYRHKLLLSELEAYGKIKTFSDVNPTKLADLMNHVAKRTRPVISNGRVVGRPISQTSVYTYWRKLARWVHLAQSRNLVAANALMGVKIPRGEYKQREHLTMEEINLWIAAEVDKPHLLLVKDMFIVQAGTGLSYVDLLETDFSRIEKRGEFYTLTGVRHKTNKPFFIVILPFALDAIKRLGNTMPSITKYNYYLKQVAGYAGVKKNVTSHVGRHTYACLCLAAGVRIEAVQRTLGHTDIRTTQIYAKLVDQDVVNAFANAKLDGVG
jgi:site-specific recombinase XerD